MALEKENFDTLTIQLSQPCSDFSSASCFISLFNKYGYKEDSTENGSGLFLEFILPIIIMGAAKDVDIKLMYKNFNYIFLYGVVGTFLNFLGLFCFLFIFHEFTNTGLLDKANRRIKSPALIGDLNRNRYCFCAFFDQKEQIPQSAYNYFRRRYFERRCCYYSFPNHFAHE